MTPPENSSAALAVSPSLPASPSPAVSAAIIAFPVGRYAIPAEDTLPGGPWAGITQGERDRINTLLDCFRQMESAPGLCQEAEALAFRLRHVRGFSKASLLALYYRWRDSGWRSLVRAYHVNKSPLPPAFLEFWRALCEQNGRSIIQAKERLYGLWFAGKPIPGYGTWVDWWHATRPMEDAPTVCPGVPEGWSKTTLYEVGPTKIERRWATRGLAAVRPLLPSQIRDTSRLLPLQLVTMDDFECDQLTYAQNPRTRTWHTVKVTGIAVMDVATRRVIALLMKPRFTDEEGKREGITRTEVRLLFYQVLRDYGVPKHGMTWLVENAAAAITTELEMTTRNLFGGRVQITRTGLIHDKTFANGFIERGGKPQQKGWIESRFNLLHNAAGDLPGQKGANYLVKPGDHEAMVQYTERLIGQGRDDAQLTDAQIARLRLPFKSADELIACYMSEIFPRLDRRVEHKMQGFELLRRWRRNEHDTWHEWEELATLTREEQLAVEWFPRELRESSRMRWDRLIRQVECEKVADHVLMMLLLTPKQAKMRKTGVTFTHNGQGYSFADKRALELRLPEGTEVLCYFDPARPQSVHICDLAGRHLVELKSLAVDIADPAAMDDATQRINELYNSIRSTIRARPLHAAADAQRLADREHNDAIVAEAHPPLPAPEAPAALPAPAPEATPMRSTSNEAVSATQPRSPVRAFLSKSRGVTAALARDQFAPGPVHTPVAEAMAQIIGAADDARAVETERRSTLRAAADESGSLVDTPAAPAPAYQDESSELL